ncbi:dodecin family protein [Halorussus halobius]|uniref:dodecin family protein n=1 Tax=Halorussus halobius TaxID=1710537 RepID=UPI001B30005D|nr:dodecin family protein [Halorussus halobius]
MTAVKIVKITGTADESWQAAAEEAFRQASETVDHISGVEVGTGPRRSKTTRSPSTARPSKSPSRFTTTECFPVHDD